MADPSGLIIPSHPQFPFSFLPPSFAVNGTFPSSRMRLFLMIAAVSLSDWLTKKLEYKRLTYTCKLALHASIIACVVATVDALTPSYI